jgi:hypothetical protein
MSIPFPLHPYIKKPKQIKDDNMELSSQEPTQPRIILRLNRTPTGTIRAATGEDLDINQSVPEQHFNDISPNDPG